MTPRPRTLVALVAAVALVAGCGSDDDAGDTRPGRDTTVAPDPAVGTSTGEQRYPDVIGAEATLTADGTWTVSAPGPPGVHRARPSGVLRSRHRGRRARRTARSRRRGRAFPGRDRASGNGKSSVGRAGLLPRLRAGALPGSEHRLMTTMTPGPDPFGERDDLTADEWNRFVPRSQPATLGSGEPRGDAVPPSACT